MRGEGLMLLPNSEWLAHTVSLNRDTPGGMHFHPWMLLLLLLLPCSSVDI